MIYHEKSEFFTNTEHGLRQIRRIRKIAYVQILIEQCWQKGYNVNSQWVNDKTI